MIVEDGQVPEVVGRVLEVTTRVVGRLQIVNVHPNVVQVILQKIIKPVNHARPKNVKIQPK